MPSDSPASLLAWLGQRQFANRTRRFLSKPRNWAILLALAAYAAFIAVAIVVFLRADAGLGRLRPSQVDVPIAAGFLALSLGYTAFMACFFGLAQFLDGDPFILGVFGSPIEALAISRYRVRRFLLLAGVGATLGAAGTAALVTMAVELPGGLTFIHVFMVLFPVSLTWVTLGFLLTAASRGWGDRGGDAVAGVIAVGLLVATAWLFSPGASAFSRLSVVVVGLFGPYVRWFIGMPLGPWGAFELVLPWVTAGVLVPIAYQVEYPMPGRFNALERRPGDEIGPGVAARDDPLSRLRRLLRFRYRDPGSGERALEGEVITLTLRSGEFFLSGLVVFFLLYLGVTTWGGGFSGSGSGRSFLTAFELGFGIWMGAFAVAFMGLAHRPLLAEQLRQLPVSARSALDGMLASKRWIVALISPLIAVVVGLTSRDPLLAVLSGTLSASVLYLVALLSLWGTPYTRPSNAPAGDVQFLPQLTGTLAGVGVLVGESAMGLFLPSPDPWNPLWLPLGISSALNLLLIWRIRPIVARRLVEPAREG